MAIDCHVHVYPEDVAKKVIPRIEEVYSAKAAHPATLAGITHALEAGGIEKALVLSSINRPEHVESFNSWCAESAKENPDLFFFGGMHPLYADWDAELERIKSLGLLGIKLQPNAHRFYPADEKIFPLYERLCELGLGLAFHAGDEVIHFEPMYSHPKNLSPVLDSFPELIIQLAHLGGYKTWDSLHYVVGRKNVWFDTAFCPGNVSDAKLRELVSEVGLDHVIFGTDFPWTDPKHEKEEIERIFAADAEKILDENPRRYLSLFL